MSHLKRKRSDTSLDGPAKKKKAKRSSKGKDEVPPSPPKPQLKKEDDGQENLAEEEGLDPAHPQYKPLLVGYRSFIGPPNAGMKVVPEGAPGCLKGKVWLITGILDSLLREEATALLKKYKGEVVTTVTKKITHALVGDKYGFTKMKKLLQNKVKTLDEDELFAFLRSTKPDQPIVTIPKIEPKPKFQITKEIFGAKESDDHELWAEKYRPNSFEELAGNQAETNKLRNWLGDWDRVQKEFASANEPPPMEADDAGGKKGKKKAAKPKVLKSALPKKCALISGPPGIGSHRLTSEGKTTAAAIVAKELGYDPIFLNASDERTQSSMEQWCLALENTSITGFFGAQATRQKKNKPLLIMDEVDGMSKGDRGGLPALCRLIPISKIPIICITNDRENKKAAPLIKLCLDVRFSKPGPLQVASRVQHVLQQENLKLDTETVNRIVQSAQGDFRQILNLLQLWKNSPTASDRAQFDKERKMKGMETIDHSDQNNIALKDFTMGSWDALPKFFNAPDKIPFGDKYQAFFADYQLGPLLVQDLYLSGYTGSIHDASRAAESISQGELISTSILSKQNWELLPAEAIFSCLSPGAICHSGGHPGFLSFPTWFTKLGSMNKRAGILKSLSDNTSLVTHANSETIRIDYLDLFAHYLTHPMAQKQKEGIADVAAFMDEYHLTAENRDEILEMAEVFTKSKGKILPATKAAFTRQFNSEHWEFKKIGSRAKTSAEVAAFTKKTASRKRAASKTKKDSSPPRASKRRKSNEKSPSEKQAPPSRFSDLFPGKLNETSPKRDHRSPREKVSPTKKQHRSREQSPKKEPAKEREVISLLSPPPKPPVAPKNVSSSSSDSDFQKTARKLYVVESKKKKSSVSSSGTPKKQGRTSRSESHKSATSMSLESPVKAKSSASKSETPKKGKSQTSKSREDESQKKKRHSESPRKSRGDDSPRKSHGGEVKTSKSREDDSPKNKKDSKASRKSRGDDSPKKGESPPKSSSHKPTKKEETSKKRARVEETPIEDDDFEEEPKKKVRSTKPRTTKKKSEKSENSEKSDEKKNRTTKTKSDKSNEKKRTTKKPIVVESSGKKLTQPNLFSFGVVQKK